MKKLLLPFFVLCICSNTLAQPSTGGKTDEASEMSGMYVDQLQYTNTQGEYKELPHGPNVLYSNTKILIPTSSYVNGKLVVTYDTIDISGVSFGGSSFTELMKKYKECPEMPDISCDSLRKLCKGIESIFWGEVFSTLTQVMSEQVAGADVKRLRSTNKNASVLITHGWTWNCKQNKWKCQLFVQIMKSKGRKESLAVFTKTLTTERCREEEEIRKDKKERKNR